MKLYYATGTCSLAPHIALREAGLAFTLVRFDIPSKALEGGGRLEDVNEKGYVPVLELDDGQRLTEVAVILQYIADRNPDAGLCPPAGTMARYRTAEWLNYIATEIHKAYWPLFHDGADVEKDKARAKLGKSFDFVEKRLGAGGAYLMGDVSVADDYLFTVQNWMKPGGIDGSQWPHLTAFRTRMRERPAVMAALEAEGLLRKR
jgi:glutathione S-transferase